MAMRFNRWWRGAALALGCVLAGTLFGAEAVCEFSVDLKLDYGDYVLGERVRGVVEVGNRSLGVIDVGSEGSPDRFFVEIYRVSDNLQLDEVSRRPYVQPFHLEQSRGGKFELFLADHYDLSREGRYRALPVLLHSGHRYEGQPRTFDMVPGRNQYAGAQQMFANHPGLVRKFSLLIWRRSDTDHLFFAAEDLEPFPRKWTTVDLGPLMKVTKPVVSVMPSGVVTVFHRIDPDNFVRSEFWSLKDALQFVRRDLVQDPETAASTRIRELYRDSGGIKPKQNPWWKFW